MGRRDDDELPPVEVLGAAPQISSVQQVSTRGPDGPRGRRGLGLVVGILVVGLLVAGAMLGEDDEVPAASEREEETTTTERRRPSTTTTQPRPRTTTTTVAEPLFAGLGVRGWLLSGNADGWTLVDIDSGARPEPGLPFDNPYSARAVAGGVVMIAGGEARFYDLTVPADVREPVSLGPADQIYTTAGDDKVWLVGTDDDALADGALARLVRLDGRELESFPLPGDPFRDLEILPIGSSAATTEGVLFGRGGQVYLADATGVEAIAVGQLLAAVGSSALIFACDEDASSCGVDLRRPTGALVRRLDLEQFSPDRGWGVSSAPDGRFAMVAHGAPPVGDSSVLTLHEPDGTTTARIEVQGYMPYGPAWLPGDVGLVSSLNGRIVWIRETPEGWVVEDVPGLPFLQSEGVLVIAEP